MFNKQGLTYDLSRQNNNFNNVTTNPYYYYHDPRAVAKHEATFKRHFYYNIDNSFSIASDNSYSYNMVFDIEIEEEVVERDECRFKLNNEDEEILTEIKNIITPISPLHQKMVRDVNDIWKHLCNNVFSKNEEDSKMNNLPDTTTNYGKCLMLARSLSCMGYEVQLTKSLGGNSASNCLKNLRHTSIQCKIEGCHEIFIIDPFFKDQFEIKKSSSMLKLLLSIVPNPLIVPLSHITTMVHILSAEISKCFKYNELMLPPWRSFQSVITKWQPNRYEIIPCSSTSFEENLNINSNEDKSLDMDENKIAAFKYTSSVHSYRIDQKAY